MNAGAKPRVEYVLVPSLMLKAGASARFGDPSECQVRGM